MLLQSSFQDWEENISVEHSECAHSVCFARYSNMSHCILPCSRTQLIQYRGMTLCSVWELWEGKASTELQYLWRVLGQSHRGMDLAKGTWWCPNSQWLLSKSRVFEPASGQYSLLYLQGIDIAFGLNTDYDYKIIDKDKDDCSKLILLSLIQCIQDIEHCCWCTRGVLCQFTYGALCSSVLKLPLSAPAVHWLCVCHNMQPVLYGRSRLSAYVAAESQSTPPLMLPA